tara:strand:+ start:1110 stop:2153 length:1044 start_codon:yes stop_codon:yes gene_type:complete
MQKYYTRACNFLYFSKSVKIKGSPLPLNGNSGIKFRSIELLTRNSKKIINLEDINALPIRLQKIIKNDLKNITKKKKFKGLKFNNNPLLMGILNLTPDSFSDGGKFLNYKSAERQINKLIISGANIIDIGGESTRPGAKDISPTEEWKRIYKKLKLIRKKKVIFSLDTRKSYVMKKSLKYGVNIINDVSGFKYDKKTINFLKKTKMPFVIHHMKGSPKRMQNNPKYKNVLLDIYDYFEEKIKYLRSIGIKHNNIILDPGIGFGKNLKHNITLISKISIFHTLGFPILLGLSRKRFIKDISNENDSKDRLGGTISSCIFSMLQGVQVLRVHDVNEIKQSIKVYKKLNF